MQEQIDAVVEDKILEALCGADTSEMVKVPSRSCLSKAFCISWQQRMFQMMPVDQPDKGKGAYAFRRQPAPADLFDVACHGKCSFSSICTM